MRTHKNLSILKMLYQCLLLIAILVFIFFFMNADGLSIEVALARDQACEGVNPGDQDMYCTSWSDACAECERKCPTTGTDAINCVNSCNKMTCTPICLSHQCPASGGGSTPPPPTPPPPPDPDEYASVAVKKIGTGTGTVKGNLTAGASTILDCGPRCSYRESTSRLEMRLVAEPASGSVFAGWTVPTTTRFLGTYACSPADSRCIIAWVNGDRDINITATFNKMAVPPTVSLTADNTNVPHNTSTTLRWSVTNATSCTASGSWTGSKNATSGTEGTGNLTSARTYALNCTGAGGSTSRSVTVNVQAPTATLTGSLTASPASGTTDTTFTFTATRTGGTATGTITYTDPVCTNGGALAGYSGTSDNTFTCKYSTSSSATPIFGSRGARMTIKQGAVSTTVAKDVTVNPSPSSVFGIDLSVSPSSGPVNTQLFNFTATPRNIPAGGAFGGYTVSYASPNCGPGGQLSNWSGATDNTFTCMYSTVGSKAITIGATASATLMPNHTATGTAGVTVDNLAIPTVSLKADNTNVPYNTGTTLRWSVTNATSCNASGAWGGVKSASGGSQGTGNLTSARTYTLNCTGAGGSDSGSVTVNVQSPPAPTLSFSANPSTVTVGNRSSLYWSSTNTSNCTGTGFITGGLTTNLSPGVSVGPLNIPTSYTITCQGLDGSNPSRSVTIGVTAVRPSLVTFTTTPKWVRPGNQTTIAWRVNNATSCNLTKNGSPTTIGSGVNGSVSDTVSAVSTYTLSCSNNPGGGVTPASNSWNTDVYVLPIYGEF